MTIGASDERRCSSASEAHSMNRHGFHRFQGLKTVGQGFICVIGEIDERIPPKMVVFAILLRQTPTS
jgi:hypothetical protein